MRLDHKTKPQFGNHTSRKQPTRHDHKIERRVTVEKPRLLGGIEQSQIREASFVAEQSPVERTRERKACVENVYIPTTLTILPLTAFLSIVLQYLSA